MALRQSNWQAGTAVDMSITWEPRVFFQPLSVSPLATMANQKDTRRTANHRSMMFFVAPKSRDVSDSSETSDVMQSGKLPHPQKKERTARDGFKTQSNLSFRPCTATTSLNPPPAFFGGDQILRMRISRITQVLSILKSLRVSKRSC